MVSAQEGEERGKHAQGKEQVMPRGNPHEGLFKEIIAIINEDDPAGICYPQSITDELLRRNYWGQIPPATPLRTVTSYFSENTPGYFIRTYGGYFLCEAYRRGKEKP